MTRLSKRIALDSVINITFVFFMSGKVGWWSLLLVPFAMWHFYDGQTRSQLKGKP